MTLTIARARSLAAAGSSSATYYRVYEAGIEVDRGHVPATHRASGAKALSCWGLGDCVHTLWSEAHRLAPDVVSKNHEEG